MYTLQQSAINNQHSAAISSNQQQSSAIISNPQHSAANPNIQ